MIGDLREAVNVILEEDIDPNLVDTHGKAAIHYAAALPHSCIAENIIDHPAFDWSLTDAETDENVLHIAVKHGHKELIEKIIASGEVGLDEPCVGGTPLIVALRNQQWEIADRLLELGVDLDGTDTQGLSAAMISVQYGSPEHTLNVLLEGSDLSRIDDQGYTVLHYAARDASPSVLQRVFELVRSFALHV